MLNLNNYTKLNLACGPKKETKFPLPWLNVDVTGKTADYLCDITKLPSDWDGHFTEVRASHVLEHFFLQDILNILIKWTKLLKHQGIVRIIVPDLDIVVQDIIRTKDKKGRDSLSVISNYSSTCTNIRYRLRLQKDISFLETPNNI